MKNLGIVGISDKIGKDLMIGIGSALAFIFLNSFNFIGAIGIPIIAQSIAGELGRAGIVIICASVFESVFFFEFILSFFDEKIADFPFIVASILTAIAFASFHFLAYSGNLQAMGGSFFSAGIVGFGWCYLKKYTKSLTPLIISHMIINAWILNNMYHYIVI